MLTHGQWSSYFHGSNTDWFYNMTSILFNSGVSIMCEPNRTERNFWSVDYGLIVLWPGKIHINTMGYLDLITLLNLFRRFFVWTGMSPTPHPTHGSEVMTSWIANKPNCNLRATKSLVAALKQIPNKYQTNIKQKSNKYQTNIKQI